MNIEYASTAMTRDTGNGSTRECTNVRIQITIKKGNFMKCLICGQRAEEDNQFCEECIEDGWPEEMYEKINEFSDADSGL